MSHLRLKKKKAKYEWDRFMGVCCISPNWLKTRTSVHVNISEVLN
jgi:hypothetical protein